MRIDTFACSGILLGLLALSLGACGTDLNPVRDAAQGVGLASPAREPADFVQQSRPARYEFLPVGVDPPPRPDRRKTEAEFRAMEAQLDAERSTVTADGARLKAQGAATPPPVAPPAPPPLPN